MVDLVHSGLTASIPGSDEVAVTPAEIMERLKSLPEYLLPHNRRFYVEAVSENARAPLIEYYRQQEVAEDAAQTWAKACGAEGFYPPRDGGHPRAFSFKVGSEPTDAAWVNAGRGYVEKHGYVAKSFSKRPAGKKLRAEIEALPAFPAYCTAMDHLNQITDLRTAKGGGGVGYSDGKIHFTVPVEINGRYFISAVNHNYDIAQAAQSAIEYEGSEHAKYAPSLNFKGDPISWRPDDGWAFLTKTELDFIIAEENMRRAAIRKSEVAA